MIVRATIPTGKVFWELLCECGATCELMFFTRNHRVTLADKFVTRECGNCHQPYFVSSPAVAEWKKMEEVKEVLGDEAPGMYVDELLRNFLGRR